MSLLVRSSLLVGSNLVANIAGTGAGGFAFTFAPAPLSVPSNTPQGTLIATIASTVPSPTRVLVNDNVQTVALNAQGNLVTGANPANYTATAPGHTFTFIIKDTSADGNTVLQAVETVTITALSVTLNNATLTPSPTFSAAALIPNYKIAAVGGLYSGTQYTASATALTADTSGTPYTGGKVALDWSGRKLLTGAVALGAAATESFYLQENLGGSIHYTALSVTGSAVVAPSALTWTAASPIITESAEPGIRSTVGTLSATASVQNNYITWTLTSNPGQLFDVDQFTGQVYPVAILSYATSPTYPLTATATDQLGNTATVSFTVSIAQWTPSALSNTLYATQMLGWADFSRTDLESLTGSNINSITAPDGLTTWSKVGATGPLQVTNAQNSLAIARFGGTNALASTDARVKAIWDVATGSGANPPYPFWFMMIVKNTYAGANAAYVVTIPATSSGPLFGAQQTASAANLSINFNNWTALPNGTYENLALTNNGPVVTAGVTLEYLQNAATGPTATAANGFGTGPARGVCIGGSSVSVAPTLGLQGDVAEFICGTGMLSSHQRNAWALYAVAKWAIPAQTTDIGLDYTIYTSILNMGFNVPNVWYDTTAQTLGTITPSLPTYSGPNPSGGAQVNNPEQSWYLDPRGPLVTNIYQSYGQAGSTLSLTASLTPPAITPFIGNSGYPVVPPLFLAGNLYPYTGANYVTQNQFKQVWGLFEYRFQMNSQTGMWPGVWLYSACTSTFEIDMMEVFGDSPDGGPLNKIVTTVHATSLSGGSQGITILNAPDWSIETGKPIVITCRKAPDFLTFYMNGVQYWQLATPPEANCAQFMLGDITVAKGGSFATPPSVNAVYPANLNIDYMRASKINQAVPTPSVGTNAKTTAFVNAVTGAGGSLTGGEQTAVNVFFNWFDAYQYDLANPTLTLTQKIDEAYCGAFADSIARTISLFDPTHFQLNNTGGVTNGAAWWAGNGTTAYLETGYDLVTQTGAGKLGARNGHMSFWAKQLPSTGALGWCLGTNMWGFQLQPASKNLAPMTGTQQRVWAATVQGQIGPITMQPGLYTMARTQSGTTVKDDFSTYYNGDWIGMITTAATTATFTSGKTLQLIGQNGTTRQFSDGQFAWFDWGSPLSQDEMPPYYAGIHNLLHAIAPGTYP